MKFANQIILFLLKGYKRLISPMLPPSCRFTPSCSEYAHGAFQKYPFFKAIWLSITRILRCHPFHPGGIDPLP